MKVFRSLKSGFQGHGRAGGHRRQASEAPGPECSTGCGFCCFPRCFHLSFQLPRTDERRSEELLLQALHSACHKRLKMLEKSRRPGSSIRPSGAPGGGNGDRARKTLENCTGLRGLDLGPYGNHCTRADVRQLVLAEKVTERVIAP